MSQDQEVNLFDMSDEDFRNAPMPNGAQEDTQDVATDHQDEHEQNDVAVEEDDAPTDDAQDPDDGEGSEDVGANGNDSSRDASESSDTPITSDTEKTDNSQVQEVSQKSPEESLKELFAPIKAAGTEIVLKDIDEARRLIQMGYDYSRKMREMKPHKRLIRTMEKHNIGEAQLSYAIDLLNGKPEAINKLVKDSGVDLSAFEYGEADTAYTPSTANVATSQEVELQEVFDSLKSSPFLPRINSVIQSEWDVPSVQQFADNPQFIRELEIDMRNGHFDKIMQEVVRQEALGNLASDMNDLERYCAIGRQLFGQAGQTQVAEQPTPLQQQQVVVAPRPKKQPTQPQQTNVHKVAPTAVSSATGQETEVDFMNMSDEAFLKARGR